MEISMTNYKLSALLSEKQVFELLKESGFDGIDYGFPNEHCAQMLDESYVSTAKKTRQALDEFGLNCYQVHAPFSFKYGENMDETSINYTHICRSIEFASILGAEIIVIHTVNNIDDEKLFFDYNLKYYHSFEALAKKFNIKIAVENLAKSRLKTPEKFRDFVAKLNSNTFCVCIDVGHCYLVDQTPEAFINVLPKGKIQCLHLHDTDLVVDRHWAPYLGLHNWDNITSALKNYGYDKPIALEVIHSFDNLDESLILPMLKYCEKAGRLLANKISSK
ncbi:MAG: sugar phosphate isomerase/epimerase [Clostridia bacterium]|nr:sugar phosphate isomerase/epimerase [Clostridia bacterium]